MDAASTGLDMERLVQAHQVGIWRYLRAIGCEASQAEDLTQETFLLVFQKPFHDHNPAATAAYLRKVARNLFISFQRRAGRMPVTAELDAVDAQWARWATKDAGQSLIQALEACLATLGEKARTALDLRFRERRTRAHIAASLGMSEAGAKNLMQRAKQHLRACIERSLG